MQMLFYSCLLMMQTILWLPNPAWAQAYRFDHLSNRIFTWQKAHHVAQDAITTPGIAAILGAKFTYGPLRKNLVEEEVQIWIDLGGGKMHIIEQVRTDAKGRIEYVLPPEELPQPGSYRIFFHVSGDGTTATAILRVVPEKTPIAIFDIDGTLTYSDGEMRYETIRRLIWDPEYVARTREGALEAVEFWKNQGAEIIYLTGRHYIFASKTREWLMERGFPSGTLWLTQATRDAWPTKKGVGRFKADRLSLIRELPLNVAAAYGNSRVDIFAYLLVGIPQDRIYMLGRHGGEERTIGVGESFLEHLRDLMSKMPFIGESHSYSMGIGGRNNFAIAD